MTKVWLRLYVGDDDFVMSTFFLNELLKKKKKD